MPELPPQSQSAAGEPGHWLLSSPHLTLTARGGERLPVHNGPGQFHTLAATAQTALRASAQGTVVVGAVPFDETTPAQLFLTRLERHPHHPQTRPQVVRALQDAVRTAWPTTRAPAGDPASESARRPRPEPPATAYCAAVRAALAAIEAGTVSKVVLARTVHIPLSDTSSHTLLASAVLTSLARREPTAHLFAVPLPRPGGHTAAPVLVGATPETLLRRTADLLTLTPLAGTITRHPDPAVDGARATMLLESAKNRDEHRHVIDTLRRQLRPLCHTLDIAATPRLHATSRLWHLSTPIHGRLRRPAPSSLALACALHPTPAVCGTPTTAAAALVRSLEPVPRRYFSGLVGWMDQSGDGHWVIALRCGEADPSGLRMYAGAGIVQGSDPEAELAETEAKLATMLGALDDLRSGPPASASASASADRTPPAARTGGTW